MRKTNIKKGNSAKDFSEEFLIEHLRKFADEEGYLKRRDFDKKSEIQSGIYQMKFGSWNKSLLRAGLNPIKNRWSYGYSYCVSCGKTDKPYKNLGYCIGCWWKTRKDEIKKWKGENRERLIKEKREWNKKNKDRIKLYDKARYDLMGDYWRKHYQDNKERIYKRQKEHLKKPRTRLLNRNRALQRRKAGDYVPKDLIFKVVERDKETCQYCGTLCTLKGDHRAKDYLTIDHVIPVKICRQLKLKNVSNFNNLAVACWECNLKKSAKLLKFNELKLASTLGADQLSWLKEVLETIENISVPI